VGDSAGYAFDVLGTQHVVYRSLDGHIHKLSFSNNSWHHYDLTIAAGAPEEPGWPISGDPVGYIFGACSEQHVVYRSTVDGRIHQLWFGHKGWHHNDLTIAVGAPEASGDPAGYVFDANAPSTWSIWAWTITSINCGGVPSCWRKSVSYLQFQIFCGNHRNYQSRT
jgi:hypothetical protein